MNLRARNLQTLSVLADLASDQGENSEYDRALVDVALNICPGLQDEDRDSVARLILSPGSALYAMLVGDRGSGAMAR